MGDLDIWMARLENGQWTQPENVSAVNTEALEGWPFLSQDGSELWFLRWHEGTSGIFRSIMVNGDWGPPELIISQFAGEPSLDAEGNLYFVHHYYEDGVMLEADIYVARKK